MQGLSPRLCLASAYHPLQTTWPGLAWPCLSRKTTESRVYNSPFEFAPCRVPHAFIRSNKKEEEEEEEERNCHAMPSFPHINTLEACLFSILSQFDIRLAHADSVAALAPLPPLLAPFTPPRGTKPPRPPPNPLPRPPKPLPRPRPRYPPRPNPVSTLP